MTTQKALEDKLYRMRGRPSYRTALSLVAQLTKHTTWSTLDYSTVDGYRWRRAITDSAENSTVNREVGFLKAACREAGITFPSLIKKLTENPRTRVLSKSEFNAILDKLPPWPRDLAIVLVGTGMRIGEALTVDPVNIKLRSASGVRITVVNPKEGQDKVVFGGIKAWAAANRLYRAGAGLKRAGSTAKADYEIFRYHLTRAAKSAGIEPVTAHDLRRTFGSWALDAGATLEQVAQCLGHRSVETTRRCYGRIDPSVRARVAALVLP